jgi:HD-GYP domain-containing protein (c-di-GMP phosphodiesterase class II)
MIEEISTSELRVGQYIVKIGQQKDDFTLSDEGYITSKAIIEHFIIKGIATVFIEPLKESKKIDGTRQKSIGILHSTSSLTPPLPHKAPSITDISQASKIFTESKKIQQKIFADALNDCPLDVEPVKEVTDKTIAAIFNNPDALACVINVRIKDEYLLEHSISVSVLMGIFSRFLNIDKTIIQQLVIGSFLHDVGKIKIPNEILNKPGKLTPFEFEKMKMHIDYSIKLINDISGLSPLSIEVAALHHEKLNGDGYPNHKRSPDISQYARMITICDIFDALTTNRIYKDSYSPIKAFNILQKLAENNKLDIKLVNLFIKCMGVYPVGSLVRLDSNQLAIVEGRNQNSPTQPLVRSFYNVGNKRYVMIKDIDLSKGKDKIISAARADDFNLDMNRIIHHLLMPA